MYVPVHTGFAVTVFSSLGVIASSEKIDSHFLFQGAFHIQYSNSCRGPPFVTFAFPLTGGDERNVDRSRFSPLVPNIVESWLLRFDHDPGSSRYACQSLSLNDPYKASRSL